MGKLYPRKINPNFFKEWNSNSSYVLGFIAADGCIGIQKGRKHPHFLNITSKDKAHLSKIKKVFGSDHKVSKKLSGSGTVSFQLQIRNLILIDDLMKLGITPKKTLTLNPINIPDEYFADFVRGFFDGDGTVYIYKVNDIWQIKAGFVCVSLPFLDDLNKKLCKRLGIVPKSIHLFLPKSNIWRYSIDFYIDDCKKLFHFFYGNNPELFLKRKKAIFERWEGIYRRRYLKRNYGSKIGRRLGISKEKAGVY